MNTRVVLHKGILVLGAFLLLLLSAGPARTQVEDQKMRSLVFQNADARSVFSMLADRGKTNIVVSPLVTGQVTISLTDVTWSQALDIITKTYSWMAVEERNYIRIVPAQQYLAEQAENAKRIAEHKLLTPLEVRIIPVFNASATDMQKAVKSMLSERGKVEIDQRTNSLIVSELPKNIDKVEEFVKKLDLETKQIKISTQLIEIENRHLFELGINWAASYRDLSVGADLDSAQISQNANQTSSPVADVLLRTSSVNWPDVQARITALATDGKIKIVSHPEITTVDNKEATVQVGQKIPIKQFDASGNTVITFYDVGTVLKVIPHVTEANKILLQLRPEKSSYQFDPNGVIINTSNAVTNVVVENGQTAVIGGLTTKDERKTTTGIPFLKDIPLLGYLFRYTRKETVDKDLVIFVTPTIVDPQDMQAKPTGMLPDASEKRN
ncbi:MAG TPA: secretin N-terminal domain-containing protein [Verrucomicrobiae bacterium]|nr:secretin N-terminal domain-containing protein [Verrucomicrobiae bacterium]